MRIGFPLIAEPLPSRGRLRRLRVGDERSDSICDAQARASIAASNGAQPKAPASPGQN
jgi:hypothetical protein